MHEAPNVIAISYAKRALLAGTREQERMKTYGRVLGSYNIVVFTKKSERYTPIQTFGNVTFHATNTRTKIGSLIKAYRIGRSIVSQDNSKWVVSGQDPLWAGVVAYMISLHTTARLHLQMHGDVFNQAFFSATKGPLIHEVAVFLLRRADKIRVVSERIARSLTPRGVSPSRVVVVPIQADLAAFLKIGSERQYQGTSALRFLYSGRLAPEKNLSLLLEAFAMGTKNCPDATLTVIGDGPCRASLLIQCKALGLEERVRFLPWTEAMPTAMAEHDVFCLASQHEGFAMVLLEAMAAGLPIITTDVGCAGELVRSGQEGVVVETKDVTAYAQAINRLATDAALRAQYGRQGYQSARTITLTEEEYLKRIRDSFTIE